MKQGFTVVELLIVILIIAIISVIALPQFINAQDRGKQTQTVANLKNIGNAMTLYHTDHDSYPVTNSITWLQSKIEEAGYMTRVPIRDGWNQLLQVTSTEDNFTIWSCGKNNAPPCELSIGTEMIINNFSDQIIMQNGTLIQFPAGAQN